MKMTIMIVFEGEPLGGVEHRAKRVLHFDCSVVLPEIGEYVANPTFGENEPISGYVRGRQFSYRDGEVNVILTLEDSRRRYASVQAEEKVQGSSPRSQAGVLARLLGR